MPAIQVARTDTFEAQRQKINQIGSTLFNITQGGSDLSTGNLKLGDGTRIAPSLAFVSDPGLGIYKPDEKTIGYVSDGSKLIDFSGEGIFSYRNFILQQKKLDSTNTSILNTGSNYDSGSYTNVPIIGGSGFGATASIDITSFIGEVTNTGKNYIPGTYTNIELDGGSGNGAIASFSVQGIQGIITDSGSSYIPGTYTNVPLININSSGIGAQATVIITGDVLLDGSITNPGSGYANNTYNAITLLNAPTTTYTVTVVSGVYRINGIAQQELTLIKGNTYRFDVSDSSNASEFLQFLNTDDSFLNESDYLIIRRGGQGTSGAFVDLIIKPSASNTTIKYDSDFTNNIGANITITTGSVGTYGSGASANLTISGGSITTFTFVSNGFDYKSGDILQIYNGDVGGTGAGFSYTLSSPIYTGTVTSIVVPASSIGSDYLKDDILSFDNSSVGGYGSGFEFTITSDPGIIQDLTFSSKGSDYEVNDILLLPSDITNVSTNLNSQVSNISTTLSNSSANITVASTTGILPGMIVTQVSGIGQLPGTTVTVETVVNLTTLTLSVIPTTSGSAILNFISPNPLSQIIVPSNVISSIIVGSIVSKTSGTGILSAGTTVLNKNVSTNVITLSSIPTQAGTAVLNFIPPFGNGTIDFSYTISKLGSIESFNILNGGNGYNINDLLSVNPSDLVNPIVYPVKVSTIQNINFIDNISSSLFSVGDTLKKLDGTIQNIFATTSTTILAAANQIYTGIVTTTNGNGSGATVTVQRASDGSVADVTLVSGGFNYSSGDTITISGNLVGGSSPTDNIVISINSVTEELSRKIYKINSSSGNITSIEIEDGFLDGDVVVYENTITPTYTINTAESGKSRFIIDDLLTPNLTFYGGNTYTFDLSDGSNNSHVFSLSQYRDGKWEPSLIEDIETTLSTSSSQITILDTTGILPGMLVEVTSGFGALVFNTKVLSVDDSTTITLSSSPLTSGLVTLKFYGTEYTTGVSRTSNSLTIKVTDSTPNLYYYCASTSSIHKNEGGDDNVEGLITTLLTSENPKVFGSGFLAKSLGIISSDIITTDVETGELNANSISAENGSFNDLTSSSLLLNSLSSSSVQTDNISSSSQFLTISPSTIFSSDVTIGVISLINSSGNITTSGILKTTNSLNVNDKLTITDSTIASTTGNNILLSPATGRVAKINTTSAITIPSGTTAQRPSAGIVESGSIRFNTDTGQYEGYSGATSSWSSLGGVRDLDGNTYIAAEATVGANDNTLYFYNDGNNTINVTPTRFIFNELKYIDSPNPLNPPSVEWTANAPVDLGDYVYYGLNLYEVTDAGTTGTSGNEPTHTTGAEINGTAELTWYANYAGDITFDKVANVNIETNLVLNNELKLFDNKITTLLSDIIIEPFAGKKVDINTNTSLVLPNGTTAERGIPGQGSVRFNSEITQFEGYNGVNWTSLGGVRDVDGNTYIIPETAPGSNENILYFFNNGDNTLRLSTTELTFDTIDQIGSVSGNLDLQASTVTFNSLAFTIDTSVSTDTKLLSTQDNLDLALSSGLTTDPLIRLTNLGDIYVNKTYGTGSNTLIKVLDNELKKFEIDDTFMETDEYVLEKGTTDTGSSVVFDPTVHSGAKVIVIADDVTNDDRDMIEFTVLSKGSDIFHTEYGNVVTGIDLIEPTFDLDAGGNVRLNIALASGVTSGDIVNITVVSTVIKK